MYEVLYRKVIGPMQYIEIWRDDIMYIHLGMCDGKSVDHVSFPFYMGEKYKEIVTELVRTIYKMVDGEFPPIEMDNDLEIRYRNIEVGGHPTYEDTISIKSLKDPVTNEYIFTLSLCVDHRVFLNVDAEIMIEISEVLKQTLKAKE